MFLQVKLKSSEDVEIIVNQLNNNGTYMQLVKEEI